MDKDIQLTTMSRKQNKNPYLFSSNERLILEAIQKHNTPLALSILTKIPRPTVYTTLEKLEVRNMVYNVKMGKKRKWFLSENVDTNKIFSNEITQSTKIGIKTYTTQKEIIDLVDSLTNPSKNRLQILNGENIINDWESIIGTNNIIKFNNKIKSSNIITELICTNTTFDKHISQFGDDWSKSYTDRPTEVHVLDKKYLDHNGQIFIYNKKVYFFMLDKPAIIEISEPSLAKVFILLFDFIKDNSRNFDMNSYVKEKTNKNKIKTP